MRITLSITHDAAPDELSTLLDGFVRGVQDPGAVLHDLLTHCAGPRPSEHHQTDEAPESR